MASPPATVRSLEPIGDARRWACDDGRELWRLGPGPGSAVAERLRSLGSVGIGGFVAAGHDDEGPWLVRERADRALAALLGEHEDQAIDWREAVELVAEVAQVLAGAERAGVFPGVIGPSSIVVAPRVWHRADDWVAELVGAPVEAPPAAAPLRREWLTPAAAAGRPDDASSNRWLLGLLLYRLLAGRGPFAGLGLRSALERVGQAIPPLPDAIARALPPGLQGLVLRILAPDPAARPADAGSLAAELLRFITDTRVGSGSTAEPAAGSAAGPAAGVAAGPAAGVAAGPAAGLGPQHRTMLFAGRKGGLRFIPADEPKAAPGNQRERASEPGGLGSASPQPSLGPTSPVRRTVDARSSWIATASRSFVVLAIVGVGLLGGSTLVDLIAAASPAPRTRPERPAVAIGSREPLDADHTSPEDCASCHPRQTAEWKRSVMGHAAKSPLFQGLEILIEEQVGRSDFCPNGAGILRTAGPTGVCRDPTSGVAITGSGGALWCANCHTPRENLAATLPPWDGFASDSTSRRPLRDLQPASTHEGIDCGFCHQVHGPVRPGDARAGRYEGNPSWISTATGVSFAMRPEDRLGIAGIANSGYALDPTGFLTGEPSQAGAGGQPGELVPGGAHRRPSAEAHEYLRSSEFCGACHDVRLFGADALATPDRGEHFRRLRNAYSEWVTWAALERGAGREPADCQDCHMSSFPGVCVAGEAPLAIAGETDLTALRRGCPPGTRFESRAPGEVPELRVAAGSGQRVDVTTHYFSGVDIPLTPEFDDAYIDQPELDAAGIPLGGEQRRDLLLGRSFRFELGDVGVRGSTLELPIELENTGAGHKIPAGFSQEREFWVHLRVSDADDRTVYEVGRVDRNDEDLRDKIFVAVNVSDRIVDQQGQPQGMFGADVVDGPDLAQWRALDARGPFTPATKFRGRGLINLQNGFLRCVQCIGIIDGAGRCQPADQVQASHRAARFADAPFDNDTGECQSNLFGEEALFETYFPVGALDATRGVTKGPDAIIDQRSAPPGVAMEWIYELALPAGTRGPLKVEARLLFRAFPPFLIRAFAAYEARQAAAGLRPSGALVSAEMLAKLEVVEIARVERTVAVQAN